MAKLDDLIAQINDPKLRGHLEEAAAELRRRKKFGLVFEQHIPETTMFPSKTVEKGSVVMIRTEPSNKTRYVVDSVTKTKASISAGEEAWTIPVADLLVVKPFGEPVYPVLRPFGEAVVRDTDKPFHTVINGENFHALQLLQFGYKGKVDCIYIDPPYNTGDKSWKYNNDFVDDSDSWRHSKWLSMMERRLDLARRLLKPDGVLIVTIDEHEVIHLGMLLEMMFPEARRQLVTMVINAGGSPRGEFSRVDEHAFYCFFGGSTVHPVSDDLLSNEATSNPTPVWFTMLRGGPESLPNDRPNLCYPLGIDPATKRIVGVGRSLKERIDSGEIPPKTNLNSYMPPSEETVEGVPACWPIRRDGALGAWQLQPPTVIRLVNEGFIRVGEFNATLNSWSVTYVREGKRRLIENGEVKTNGREPNNGPWIVVDSSSGVKPKTVWKRTRHDSGKTGSAILKQLVGPNSFNFPKSPYLTADTIRPIVTDNRSALILDFFAGSGTTLQSVAMLNAKDDGTRRCILVTNNELDEETASVLEAQGLAPGDEDYEARGICRAVTIPRVRAALTGRRADGSPVAETYLDGTEVSDGFEENATFFDLVYADPDAIDVGAEFDDVIPALWMAAGCQGNPADLEHDTAWLLSSSSRFAVLLDEDRFRRFSAELSKHPEITHIWLVTDSETAFARMRDGISGSRTVGMLYRDYLRNFRVNVDMSAAAAGVL